MKFKRICLPFHLISFTRGRGTVGLGTSQSSSEPRNSLIRVVKCIGVLEIREFHELPISGALMQVGFWSGLEQGSWRSSVRLLHSWMSLTCFIRNHFLRFFGLARFIKRLVIILCLAVEFRGLLPQEANIDDYCSVLSSPDPSSCFLILFDNSWFDF